MVYRNITMLLFFIYGNTLYSAVNEVIPGDYEAPRVGMNLVTLYFSEKKMVGPYAQGEKLNYRSRHFTYQRIKTDLNDHYGWVYGLSHGRSSIFCY